MIEAARRHLVEIEPDAAGPGDVLRLPVAAGDGGQARWRLVSAATMIHAMEGAPVGGGAAGAVVAAADRGALLISRR